MGRKFLRLFADYRALEAQLGQFAVAAVIDAADVIRSRSAAAEWKELYLREKGALEAALAQMVKG